MKLGLSGAVRLQYHTIKNTHKPGTDNISFQLRTLCGNNTFSTMTELKDLKNFDPEKKVVFFVTGWTTSIKSEANDLMAEAFACRGDINFIVIHYKIFESFNYQIFSWFLIIKLMILNVSVVIVANWCRWLHSNLVRLVGPQYQATGRLYWWMFGWAIKVCW